MIYPTSMKKCNVCQQEKPTTEFYLQSKGYCRQPCKKCWAKKAAENPRLHSPEYKAKMAKRKREKRAEGKPPRIFNPIKKYGMTGGELQVWKKYQGNICGICKEDGKRLVIDHNHKTNQARGLLCYRCNNLVGFIENNPKLIAPAQEYIATH